MLNLNNIPSEEKAKLFFAFGMGTFTGSITSALLGRKFMRDLVKMDERSKARQKVTFDYLITTMGPHVPREVLQDVLTHLEFDSVVVHNEDPSQS